MGTATSIHGEVTTSGLGHWLPQGGGKGQRPRGIQAPVSPECVGGWAKPAQEKAKLSSVLFSLHKILPTHQDPKRAGAGGGEDEAAGSVGVRKSRNKS